MRFNYQGCNKLDAFCDIEVIGNLVIATELPDNTGQSITNAAEELATSVCLRNSIPMKDLIWIERYHNRPEEHDRVFFIFDGEKLICPNWRRIDNKWLDDVKEFQKLKLMKGSD